MVCRVIVGSNARFGCEDIASAIAYIAAYIKIQIKMCKRKWRYTACLAQPSLITQWKAALPFLSLLLTLLFPHALLFSYISDTGHIDITAVAAHIVENLSIAVTMVSVITIAVITTRTEGAGGVQVPPLRVRPADVADLQKLFARGIAKTRGQASLTLTPEAVLQLESYNFPGNIKACMCLYLFILCCIRCWNVLCTLFTVSMRRKPDLSIALCEVLAHDRRVQT